MPKVSVIIPLYRSQQFICETLHPIQAQAFTDFEIVVVDDRFCWPNPRAPWRRLLLASSEFRCSR